MKKTLTGIFFLTLMAFIGAEKIAAGSGGVSTGRSGSINLSAVAASINLPTNLQNLGGILTKILPYFYAFAGTGLLFFLILGGFKYLTSAGDPKKTESAKGTITAAVIGFVVIMVAYWLTQIVNFVFKLGMGV